MSKNLEKLAYEIEGLVDGLLSKAQALPPAPMEAPGAEPMATEDPNNNFPQGAVRSIMKGSGKALIAKFNEIIQKLNDEEYAVSNALTAIDGKAEAVYAGGKYKSVKIWLVLDPNWVDQKNEDGELTGTALASRKILQFFQPMMTAMSAKALMSANKQRKPGNSSFGLHIPDLVKLS